MKHERMTAEDRAIIERAKARGGRYIGASMALDNVSDADIMRGIEAAKRWNRSPLPLVAMAAYGMSDDEARALDSECR